MVKLLVVGLDSACWEFIDRFIEKGELSFIKSLKDKGSYCELVSTYPPITNPAWKCYSTGKNPGKLGVYNWTIFDKDTKKVAIALSNHFKGQEIWDYLSLCGKESLVINMPLTYPPKRINGTMISGIHARSWKDYTYPKSIKGMLEDRHGYDVLPQVNFKDIESTLPKALDAIRSRFDVAMDLSSQKDYDFVQITIFIIDPVHHFHWHTIDDPDSPILRMWRLIDSKLNEYIESYKPENVMLVSDHGMTRLDCSVRINEWLEKNGYLSFKKAHSAIRLNDMLRLLHINKNRLARLYSLTPKALVKLVPYRYHIRMVQELEDEYGESGILSRISLVDWDKTKAIDIGEGLIYILDNMDAEGRKELIEGLEELGKTIEGGGAFSINLKEDMYWGDNLANSPDICLLPKRGLYINDKISKKGGIISKESRWKAFHQHEGLFLACGNDFKSLGRIEKRSIYDVAPTILKLFGIRPEDMDGTAIDCLYKNGHEAAIDTKRILTDNEKRNVKRNIRKMENI